MIKAPFFDTDGTLVSLNMHEISSSTFSAIIEAKTKGIKIFIVVGRPKAIINNLSAFQKQDSIDGYITMSGGYRFAGDEVIYRHSTPAEGVKISVALSDEKGFPYVLVAEHAVTVCSPNELVNQIFREFLHVDILPVRTIAEATQTEIFQMTPFITTGDEKNILPPLPHCESGRWSPAFIDIAAKGTRKQKEVDKIIYHLDIRPEETMVFGDGDNDISMLRHVTIRVAMGNVNDEAKKAADYVTASVDKDDI